MKRIAPLIIIAGLISLALYLTLNASLDELEILDQKVAEAKGHLDQAFELHGMAAQQISTSFQEQLAEETLESKELQDAVRQLEEAGSLAGKFQAARDLDPKVDQALQTLDKSLRLQELWLKNSNLLLIARNYYNAQVVQYSLALKSLPLKLLDDLWRLPRHRIVGMEQIEPPIEPGTD